MKTKVFLLMLFILIAGCVETQKTNKTMEQEPTIIVDTSLSMPVVSPENNTFIDSSKISIYFEFDEPVIVTDFRIDGISEDITNINHVIFRKEVTLEDGNHTVTLNATDVAGNKRHIYLTFTIDTKEITAEITPSDGSTIYTTSPEIALSFNKEVVLTKTTLDDEEVTFTTEDNKTFTYTPSSLLRKTHTLKIEAEDATGRTFTKTIEFTISKVEDKTPPQISDIDVSVSGTTVTITWNTDEEATSKVEYGTTQSLGSEKKKTAYVNLHSITISDLLPSKTYYYRVVSEDMSGNIGTSNIDTFKTGSDTTPPDPIAGLKAQDTENGGEVYLEWDESDASDFDHYRIYKSTSSISSVSDLTPIKKIYEKDKTNYTVTGLTNGVQYCFAVTAVDTDGNENVDDITDNCRTPTDKKAPTISSVTATSITTENATITWTTDESSNSTVYYGTSSSTLDNTVTDNSSVTSHSIKLSGLTSNTTYYYKVKSCDASGKCNESDVYNFTTAEPDTTPPTISNAQPTGTIGTNTTTLQVTTDEDATCKYDTSDVDYDSMNNTFSTTGGVSHSESLASLSDGDHTYYVRCMDVQGNKNTASTQITFTVDTTPPTISSVSSSVTNTSATITWTTDENATSVVYYGTDCTTLGSEESDSTLVTSHSIDLTGLQNGTTYYFEVESADSVGNTAS
ncbi:MAG: fibronectin type III domain-containing protein, partial [Candidatus Diapherotrites archaeon]|nr:fibronectin type III domain-containing protein [Candidatus Diapherotrites archaeon]